MYQYQEAYMDVLGGVYKKHIKEYPLLTYFVLGIAKGGYWNYIQMGDQF